MKIFISHKKCDSKIALQIAKEFQSRNIDIYLDALDETINISQGSKELTNHLKSEIESSSDILVVMSDQTRLSWWVPFEIGMAADQNMPIVTYLHNDVHLPEYLDYWPRLSYLTDIDIYINHIKKRIFRESIKKESVNFSRKNSILDNFYADLKENLNLE